MKLVWERVIEREFWPGENYSHTIVNDIATTNQRRDRMTVLFTLSLPACDHCRRPAEDNVRRHYLTNNVLAVYVEAGLVSDDQFEGMGASQAAKIFRAVLHRLNTNPLAWIERFYFHHAGSYSDEIMDLNRWIQDLELYPNGWLTVTIKE